MSTPTSLNMSTPTSLKLWPPLYIDPRVRRRYIWIYVLQIWLSVLPAAWMVFWYFSSYIQKYILYPFSLTYLPWTFQNLVDPVGKVSPHVFMICSPLYLVFVYILTVVWTAFLTRGLLMVLNRIHLPRQGVFFRSLTDKDYVFWNLRNLARLFLFWLLWSVPFPLLRPTFGYKFFGIPIGKNSIFTHSWVTAEFIRIGSNVQIGQAAAIYSYQIQDDKILVAEVVIEDNVIIGPQVVLFPGTVVHQNVVIDGGAFADPFFVFEANGVYHGAPVKLIRINPPSDKTLEEE